MRTIDSIFSACPFILGHEMGVQAERNRKEHKIGGGLTLQTRVTRLPSTTTRNAHHLGSERNALSAIHPSKPVSCWRHSSRLFPPILSESEGSIRAAWGRRSPP